MATNDKDGGEFRGLPEEGGNGDGVLPELGFGGEEVLRGGIGSAEFDAGGVQGGFAAKGGGHGQVGDGGQNVVGVRELGLPGGLVHTFARELGAYQEPAGGFSGGAELRVGSEDEEDVGLGRHGDWIY